MKAFRRIVCIVLGAVMVFATLMVFGCDVFDPDPSPNPQPHLISADQAEANPIRPINKSGVPVAEITETSARDQMDEMLDLVARGYRPNVKASHVESLVRVTYETAIAVLNRYIKNDFSAYERVHAIHDYLTYFVEYDFDLNDRSLQGLPVDGANPSFWADGALINKLAVCDGLSRAFVLLCAIEGIEACRIEGVYYGDGGGRQNHAWNKVRLEADGDWYNVDITLNNAYASVGSSVTKILHHGFFLISDEAISSTYIGRHEELNPSLNPIARGNYPFHEQEDGLVIGGVQRNMVAGSRSDLVAMFEAVAKSNRKIGKIEVQMQFGLEDWRDPDSFLNDISAAYRKVPDKDYAYDGKSKLPFFRYPNGVFVFLIYK